MTARPAAIVAGGSSGIGLATAKELAAHGYDVAIVARYRSRLEAAAEAVAHVGGPGARVEWASCDLSSWDATDAVFADLAERGFSPDVLICSAGVIIPGEFLTMTPEEFESNLTAGFWSVVHACRAAAPRMVERGSGHIVNISSVAGYLGIYGYTGYSSAKFAVMGFTEALRFEMKPHGVRVSVVCPPDTDTPALAHERTLRPSETDVIAGNIKPISAEKVARAVVRAIGRGRFVVIPDALSAFYFRLKGVAPEVFHAIVDGDVAKARRSK